MRLKISLLLLISISIRYIDPTSLSPIGNSILGSSRQSNLDTLEHISIRIRPKLVRTVSTIDKQSDNKLFFIEVVIRTDFRLFD